VGSVENLLNAISQNFWFLEIAPLRSDASKYVFKCRLKVDSDDDGVTNDGKLFHEQAAAMGKARSPIVLQRVTGTTTAVDCMLALRMI